jgi:hypothetical protein
MSVFNNKFSISSLRDDKSPKPLKRIKIMKVDDLEVIEEDMPKEDFIKKINKKFIKKTDTVEFKELPTYDTITRISSNKKIKRVKFKTPFVEVVNIKSYKNYYNESKEEKKKTETCRCLVF